MTASEGKTHEPLVVGVLHGAAVGAAAGAAAGLFDAIWSMRLASQFVSGLGMARLALYLMVAYGLLGFVLGLVASTGILSLLRFTRLGVTWELISTAHATRRADNPTRVVPAASVALIFPMALLVSVVVVTRLVTPMVSGRQSVQLVVLVVALATVVAVVLSIPLAFVLGRVLEAPLRWAMRQPKLAPWLSQIWFPLAKNVGLAVIGILAFLVLRGAKPEAALIRGPLVVFLVGGLATVPLSRWLRRARGWALSRRQLVVLIALTAAPVLLVSAMMFLGSSQGVMKAQSTYSALGTRLTRLVRRPFDLDRDGYARVLGGGDCNDSNSEIHPGAVDIPGDGIDQNCVGGDAPWPGQVLDAGDPGFASLPASLPSKLNFILITVDTTRADHLGTYGYKRNTSPNLDALGASGQVFEHAWSNAPATYYSMPTILTGRMPMDIHQGPVLDGSATVAPEATTIAEALRPLGYTSGAIVNLPYFARERGLDQGFDMYDNENASLHARVGAGNAAGSSSPAQTAKALAFLDEHGQKKFFLWVHYFDPHYNYEAHAGAPSFGKKPIDRYDGEIHFTDAAIGTLLDGLRSRGLDATTAVVVTSDHGESFGEHGEVFHGAQLYSPQTHVPMIMRVPGMPTRRITTPTSHVDILPTIVNLAGGKPSYDMMGSSMVSSLTGTDRPRTVFQQLPLKSHRQRRGAVDETCHVIYSRLPDVTWEVYRTDRDPGERHDLADTGECAEVRAALASWCNDCN